MTFSGCPFIVIVLGRMSENGGNMARQNNEVPEKILNAAYKSLTEKGYAAISLREIAKEAGVALSQLHYYFGSKQTLFKAIIMKMKDRYIMVFKDNIKTVETADEKIDAIIDLFDELFQNDPALIRLFFDLYSLSLWSEDFKSLLASLMDEINDLVKVEIVEELSDSDTVANISKTDFSKVIVGAVFGMALQYTLSPEENKELIKSLKIVPKLRNE